MNKIILGLLLIASSVSAQEGSPSYTSSGGNAIRIGGVAGGDLTGTYPNPTIGALKIGSSKISALAIDSEKLAKASVDSEKYVSASIGNSHIVNLTIDSTKLKAASVDSEKLVLASVGKAHLTDNAVETAKQAADSVTSAKIITGAVDTRTLNADAITTTKILTGAVTSAKTTGASVSACGAAQYVSAATVVNGLITSAGACVTAGAGGGDVVLASTQTFTGANTFNSLVTNNLSVSTQSINSGFSARKGSNSQNGMTCIGGSQPNMSCWEVDGQTSGVTTLTSMTNDNNAGFVFRTKGAAGLASEVMAMKITGAGSVGIGTTAPAVALDVVGSAKISTVGNGTARALCMNSSGFISTCTGLVGADGTCSCQN